MVKCSSCGIDVDDDFENCPNCGSNLNKSEKSKEEDTKATTLKCSNCGEELKEEDSFCHKCGQKAEYPEEPTLKCSNCGSDLAENTLFCSTCGAKVESTKTVTKKSCPNCGNELDEHVTFCDECGANVFAGAKNNQKKTSPNSFSSKINFNLLIKPTIIALIVAMVLSVIGLLIGFSWVSFIIAIILSVGFFAAAIDNEANAIVFGLVVGLILGLLENPLVEFTYGAFVAGVYQGFFGGNLILIVIVGVIMAYISNIYLKETILRVTHNFKGLL